MQTVYIAAEHDKEFNCSNIEPTDKLFYSGIDGNPGRYFRVKVEAYGLIESIKIEDEIYPCTYQMSKDCWQDSLGLKLK